MINKIKVEEMIHHGYFTLMSTHLHDNNPLKLITSCNVITSEFEGWEYIEDDGLLTKVDCPDCQSSWHYEKALKKQRDNWVYGCMKFSEGYIRGVI